MASRACLATLVAGTCGGTSETRDIALYKICQHMGVTAALPPGPWLHIGGRRAEEASRRKQGP